MFQKSTIPWDALRVLLAATRAGSARGAAADLGVSHSTVTRQLRLLEDSLKARLFDRSARGMTLTGEGEALVEHARTVEDTILSAERTLAGREEQLSGEIVVTTAEVLATHLLMPVFAAFAARYPEISLNLHVSDDVIDLRRREADVAIRVMPCEVDPPDLLVGRRVARAASCHYAAPVYLAEHDLEDPACGARWLGWDDDDAHPDWVRSSPHPDFPVTGRMNNTLLQLAAAEAAMGLAVLPCFVGDGSAALQRLPRAAPYYRFDVWILTHPDLRDTARLRTFRRHVAEALAGLEDRLLGDT
ncbi:MAG: LysR family transcriptional regulator [Pseudomonadota bacterium]